MTEMPGMLIGQYDWRLVALSLTIAVGASYTALDMAGRVSSARARARLLWLIAGAGSLGVGIWAMHYIGMLAYRLQVPVFYSLPVVGASLLAAVASSAVALYVVSRRHLRTTYLLGGSLAMGSGIAAMHYIGMHAMQLAAHRAYRPGLVALSIVIAVAVSGAALYLAFQLRDAARNSAWSRPLAAVVMGLAIASMHYTGMAAVCFLPGAGPHAGSDTVGITSLGILSIAIVTFGMLGLSLLGSLANRRFSEHRQGVDAQMERWGRLLGTSSDGLFDVDLITGVIFLSPRWMTMLGYEPGELPLEENTWVDLLHPDEREAVVGRQAAYLAAGQGVNEVEFQMRHRDGSWRWIHCRMQAVWDERGTPVRLTGSHTDITVRKQHEEQLRASERKYREMFEANPTPGWIYRVHDLRIMNVNQSAIHHYGWSREQFLAMTVSDIRIPSEVGDIEAALREHAVNGLPVKPLRHRRNQRSDIWVALSSQELQVDGLPARLIMSNDITALLDAETQVKQAYDQMESLVSERTVELQASRAEWQGLLEALPQIIWLTNREGWVTYISNSGERYSGVPTGDLMGRGFLTIMHPEDVASVAAERRVAFATQSPYEAEVRLRAADGTYRWFRASARPLYEDSAGTFTRWLGCSTDIDDQKRGKEVLEAAVAQRTVALEEARARAESAVQAKSEFLAAMSHEIRTPMNGVMGMAHLMMDTPLNATQRSYLDTIRSSGQALLAIINDILDFSKIEAGRMDIYPEEFELGTILEDCVDLVSPQAALKRLRLTSDIGDEVPKRVTGDSGRIRQVLLNLLSNAVKFTPSGSVSLSVHRENWDSETGLVRFSVSDSGIGLSPEQQGKLFQAFMQADLSTTRRFGGTGLGLSIAKRLVELMGGTIDVDSEPGVGSTFWFCLPLPPAAATDVDAPSVLRESSVSFKDLFAGSPARLLVADDVVVNQMVASGLLRELGLNSDVVSSGAEAIAAIEATAYDLVLMDVHMPGMDGLEATQRIRESELASRYGGRRLPIIALTASAMPGERQRLLEAGMDDFIAKPVMPGLLVQVLRKWLPSGEGVSGRDFETKAQRPAAPAMPVQPPACTFDRPGLLRRLMGDELLARAVMDGFACDLPLQIESMVRLVKAGNLEDAADLAHRMRGAAATVGAEALRGIASEIETAGRSGNLAAVESLTSGLQEQFSVLMESFAALPTKSA